MYEPLSCGYCDNGLFQFTKVIKFHTYVFMARCNCDLGMNYHKFVKWNGELLKTKPEFPIRDPRNFDLLYPISKSRKKKISAIDVKRVKDDLFKSEPTPFSGTKPELSPEAPPEVEHELDAIRQKQIDKHKQNVVESEAEAKASSVETETEDADLSGVPF